MAEMEQQTALRDFAEQFVLLYSANCIFKGEATKIDFLVKEVFGSSGFIVRPELLNRLQHEGSTPDFYMDFAQLVLFERRAHTDEGQGTPRQAFELAFKVMQMAQLNGSQKLFSETLLPWLEQRWAFCWDRQRFLMSDPLLHAEAIRTAFEREGVSSETKVVQVLLSILPTLGIENKSQLQEILGKLIVS